MKNHHHHSRGREPHRSSRSFDIGPGFGPGLDLGLDVGPSGRGRPRGRRRGGRGGDVRAAVLLLLEEQPRHGYQLIQEIGERSEGSWTPSPGSVYPVLQQLEDEGLVEFERVEGRKTASLTESGRALVEEQREQLGAPWTQADRPRRTPESQALAESLKAFLQAWKQVASLGTPEQQHLATETVDAARKQLYRILADD